MRADWVIFVASCLSLSFSNALLANYPLQMFPPPFPSHSFLNKDPSGALSPNYNFAPVTQNFQVGHPTGSLGPWPGHSSSLRLDQVPPAYMDFDQTHPGPFPGLQFFQQAGSFGGSLPMIPSPLLQTAAQSIPILHEPVLQPSALSQRMIHVQTVPQSISSHVVMSSPMRSPFPALPQIIPHPMALEPQIVPEMPRGIVSLSLPEQNLPSYGAVQHVQLVQEPAPMELSMLSSPPREVIHVTGMDQWGDPASEVSSLKAQAVTEAGKVLVRDRTLLLRLGDAMSEITGKTDFFLCPLLMKPSATTLMTPPSRTEVLACLSAPACDMLVEHGPELCRCVPGSCSLVVTLSRLCPIMYGRTTRPSALLPLKRK